MNKPQTTDRIAEHMEMLVNQIGERPGGSPACARAEAYIQSQFAGYGWQVERQPFGCPSWEDCATTLLLNGRKLPAAANAYAPSCDALGAAVPLGTLAELESADLNGRIAVLYGALIAAPLSPKSWFLKSELDDRIIQLLEEGRPQALITVQHIGGGRERLIEDWEFVIPSATVTAETGREIIQAADAQLHLQIDSHRAPGETANIVGRAGSHRKRVVLCAHHDTKIDTPGACDNASGVAVLLALAEVLDKSAYPFTLELVSFTNEEYMPIGDDEYLRLGGDDLSDVIACINTDGVGQLLAPDSITAISSAPAFESALKALAATRHDLVWADPWPESNHSTFSFRGVSSVAFTSTSRVALAHHPYDDLSWSDAGRISRLVPVIKSILDILAVKPQEWSRAG